MNVLYSSENYQYNLVLEILFQYFWYIVINFNFFHHIVFGLMQLIINKMPVITIRSKIYGRILCDILCSVFKIWIIKLKPISRWSFYKLDIAFAIRWKYANNEHSSVIDFLERLNDFLNTIIVILWAKIFCVITYKEAPNERKQT